MLLVARQGTNKCKGPEMGKSLACLRNRKEISDLVWRVCCKKRQAGPGHIWFR